MQKKLLATVVFGEKVYAPCACKVVGWVSLFARSLRREIIALRVAPRSQGMGVSYAATAASKDFCQRLFIFDTFLFRALF